MLTERFTRACALALSLHAQQLRKGTTIPYAAHLLAVASLVLEQGGNEDQAIAALLHDAVEDQGGLTTLRLISDDFGPRVAAMVMACTDAAPEPGHAKASWHERKSAFIRRLRTTPLEVALVVACDKLHNLRCLVADLERDGPSTLVRFNHPADLNWYFAGVLDALEPFGGSLPLQALRVAHRRFGELTRGTAPPPGRVDA